MVYRNCKCNTLDGVIGKREKELQKMLNSVIEVGMESELMQLKQGSLNGSRNIWH